MRSTMSEGMVFPTNNCGDFEIVEVLGSKCRGRFLNTDNVDTFKNKHIKCGKIKDQKAPLTFGVGYTDGVLTKKDKTHLNYYNYWKQILERGYCAKLKSKYPSYLEVTVCEEWHSLKNFKTWFEDNFPKVEGCYDLDKDLLSGENKIYSPLTCVFLPKRINTLLINKYHNRKGKVLPIGVTQKREGGKYCARCHIGEKQPFVIGYFDCPDRAWESYRDFKQDYIRSLAEEYNDKGMLCERAYTALTSYEVKKEYQ